MNNKYSLPKDGGLIAESVPRDIIHRYEKILHGPLSERIRRRAVRRRQHRQGDPHVQRTPLLERGLRRVAAVRAGSHDGAHPAGSLPRTGEAPRGGTDQFPQRRGVQPRRVPRWDRTRTAEPQLPHPRGVPRPASTSCPSTCAFPTARCPRTRFRSTARRTTIRCAAST